MSDIFISYNNEDRLRAQTFAQALEGRGWSIFWDQTIPYGKTWRETIGKELNEARCVIVLWSKTSIESGWVQEEADDAKRRGILVPVLIENVQPPIGFRSIHAADLTRWDATESAPLFNRLIADIAALIGPAPANEPPPPFSARDSPRTDARPSPRLAKEPPLPPPLPSSLAPPEAKKGPGSPMPLFLHLGAEKSPSLPPIPSNPKPNLWIIGMFGFTTLSAPIVFLYLLLANDFIREDSINPRTIVIARNLMIIMLIYRFIFCFAGVFLWTSYQRTRFISFLIITCYAVDSLVIIRSDDSFLVNLSPLIIIPEILLSLGLFVLMVVFYKSLYKGRGVLS
jgi:hypothetical protein